MDQLDRDLERNVDSNHKVVWNTLKNPKYRLMVFIIIILLIGLFLIPTSLSIKSSPVSDELQSLVGALLLPVLSGNHTSTSDSD